MQYGTYPLCFSVTSQPLSRPVTVLKPYRFSVHTFRSSANDYVHLNDNVHFMVLKVHTQERERQRDRESQRERERDRDRDRETERDRDRDRKKKEKKIYDLIGRDRGMRGLNNVVLLRIYPTSLSLVWTWRASFLTRLSREKGDLSKFTIESRCLAVLNGVLNLRIRQNDVVSK